MVRSILVVCVGNVCRSPIGERVLVSKLKDLDLLIDVSSAGLGALVGHAADKTAAIVAATNGISLDGHRARQFSRELGVKTDLIIVMEQRHRHEIIQTNPDLSGKVMLFDHWLGAKGIIDPYGRSQQFHEETFAKIDEASSAWIDRLMTLSRK